MFDASSTTAYRSVESEHVRHRNLNQYVASGPVNYFIPTYMLLYSDILGKEKHGFPWVSSFPSFYPLTPVPQTVSSLRRAAEQPKICVVSDFDEMLDA